MSPQKPSTVSSEMLMAMLIKSRENHHSCDGRASFGYSSLLLFGSEKMHCHMYTQRVLLSVNRTAGQTQCQS